MAYTNLDYLKEFTGNDPQMIKEGVQRYLKKSPVLLEELNSGYQNKDWEKVAFTAHNLYSASQIVGVERIKEPLIKIQDLTKEKQDVDETEELKKYLDEVNVAIRGSIEELNTYQ